MRVVLCARTLVVVGRRGRLSLGQRVPAVSGHHCCPRLVLGTLGLVGGGGNFVGVVVLDDLFGGLAFVAHAVDGGLAEHLGGSVFVVGRPRAVFVVVDVTCTH